MRLDETPQLVSGMTPAANTSISHMASQLVVVGWLRTVMYKGAGGAGGGAGGDGGASGGDGGRGGDGGGEVGGDTGGGRNGGRGGGGDSGGGVSGGGGDGGGERQLPSRLQGSPQRSMASMTSPSAQPIFGTWKAGFSTQKAPAPTAASVAQATSMWIWKAVVPAGTLMVSPERVNGSPQTESSINPNVPSDCTYPLTTRQYSVLV
eukprot:1662757-Prymnesium_polylepis.1